MFENMGENQKLIAKVIIIVAVLGLVGYGVYQKIRVAEKKTSRKLEVPEVKTDLKILKILEVKSKQSVSVQDIHTGENFNIFIPTDIKPNFIGVKDIQKNYVLELFKYRPTANDLVALSLNVVKDFPTTKIFPLDNSLIGGTVLDIQKGVIVLSTSAGLEPGKFNDQKIAVNSSTTYTQFIHLGRASVTKPATLANVQKGNILNIIYNKKDSTPDGLKASKVEIVTLGGNAPANGPPKQ